MEIKFRIWDYDTKQMYYSEDRDVIISFQQGVTVYLVKEKKELTNFKLMQHIGLTDKHNNDIYSHDIVHIEGENFGDDEENFMITYDKKTARFILVNNTLTLDFDVIYKYQCEVMGNAFKTPECLYMRW